MDELELIGSVYMYVNIRCASKNEYYTVPVHPGKCKSQNGAAKIYVGGRVK